MEEQTIHSRLDAVEIRARRLDRRLKLAIYGWLLTVSVFLLSAWTRRPWPQRESKEQLSVLRARQLIIADEKGVDRIVVGPVSDPQVMGKRVKRRVPGTGVQLNDASGNERGGIALLDDGSVVVGIDDEKGAGTRSFVFHTDARCRLAAARWKRNGENIAPDSPERGTISQPQIRNDRPSGQIYLRCTNPEVKP